MSESAPRAVFLSYASQDTPAAAALAAALRAGGIEVWFDQDELRGGEAWDAKIKKQIRECALFVPIVSASTQARPEGYFRLEWHLAEQRSLLIAKGRPFIVPVCIDATPDHDALVPDVFLHVQWTRLPLEPAQGLPPAGAIAADFVAQVKRLLVAGAAPAGAGSAGPRGSGSQPAKAAPMHAGPPPVPDYELLRQIGHGGYGEVWLARGLTGVYRAVKVVWRDRFADASPYEREFRGVKEAMAFSLEAGQLPLLHVGRNEAGGYFYYVMELADDAKGGRTIDPEHYVPLTLKEVKARAGRLPAAQCFAFAEDLARGLATLHARGLVHRDIKPSNVVIVHGRPTLADIGLLATVGDAHTYVGTQGYLAPEGPGSPVADVFALGKLLYELATGYDREQFPRLPEDVTDRTERATLFAFNEILLRACEPLAQNRYRDATILLADLQARRARMKRRRARWRWALGAAGVAAALAAAVFRPHAMPAAPPPAAPATAPVEKSIAVLPFANLSDDRENGYFADGVSEDILNDLANLSSLRVIARTTMQQYRQTTKPIRQIASELTVAYVLEGSVRRAGNKIRVTGQLIRAASEQPVWAKTYDRDLTDVFALQSELSHDIVAALQGVLTPQDESRLTSRPTSNIAAYDLYRQARALAENPADSELVPQKQLPLLERAVQLDPNYADAWVMLADAHLGMAMKPFQEPDETLVAQARSDLERAERLAPDSYNVLMKRADFAAFKGDRATVNRYRQRIVELFPGRAEAWLAVGLAAAHEHRHRDEIAAYRQALAIDPRNVDILGQLKDSFDALRRYDECAEVIQRLRALQPANRQLEFEQALLPLRQRGSTAELQALLTRLPAHPEPADTDLIIIRSQAYFLLGDAADFVRFWREMGPAWRFHEARVLDEPVLAMALQALHDPTDIRPLLEKARDRMRAVLQREPRNAPRWNQLGLILAMMGEKTEARAALARVRELGNATDTSGRPVAERGVIFYNAIWRGWAGEVAEAVPQMAVPLRGSTPTLYAYVQEMRVSFLTLPFRGDPAFEALLADPANNAPIYENESPVPVVAPPAGTLPAAPEKSIAVLPFENLSENKENGYLADGIQDDVITDLAGVRALKVVSRASAARYRGTTKSMTQVGAELGVAFVLTGSVRREADSVRVSAQLIDARTERQVWAKRFDREVRQVLALQSDLSAEIVPALQVALDPAEKTALLANATTSGSAYDLFLRARSLRQADGGFYQDREKSQQAGAWLRQAVAEDPRFVRAWVELAILYAEQHFNLPEYRTPAQLARADEAMGRAVALAPGEPEVILGQGLVRYYGYRDYPGALASYQKILQNYPHYPDVRLPLGLLDRRTGRWPEALAILREAHRQEPGNFGIFSILVSTLSWVRRHDEIYALVREQRHFSPDDNNLRWGVALLGFRRDGTRVEYDRWLRELSPEKRESEEIVPLRFEWALVVGDEAEVAELVRRHGLGLDILPAALVLIQQGRRDEAMELLAKLKPELDRQFAEDAQSIRTWATAAHYHALRGERAEALQAIEHARLLLRESRGGFEDDMVAVSLAQALAALGERDAAVAEITRLLRLPTGLSGWNLQHSISWLPLRDDPRVQALIADPRNSAPLVDDDNRFVTP